MQALEAILFLAREPLNARKLAQYANLADGTEALTLVRQLNQLYDAEGRAFRVEQVAGGFQLLTRPALADWVRRLAGTPPEIRLSAPAMETLAVVAYRQPILRAEIEAIRGVACGEILRQLMERNLVRIAGRSSDLGRPFVYGTTDRFLHVFGLGTLDDLPRADALRRALPGSQTTTATVISDSSMETKEGTAVTKMQSDLLEDETMIKPEWPAGNPRSTAPALAFDDEDEGEEEEEDEEEDEDFDDEFDDDEFDDEEFDEDEDEDWEDEDEEWEEVEDDDEEEEEEEWDDEEEDEDDWEEDEDEADDED